MRRARAFGTGDRMRSDEELGRGELRFDRLDDLPLGAAGVGHEGPCGYGLGSPATLCGIRLTGVQTTTTLASATPASRSVEA